MKKILEQINLKEGYLTVDEEELLFSLINDNNLGNFAKEIIIKKHEALIISVIKSLHAKSCNYDDLLSVGKMSLYNSIYKYSFNKDIRFGVASKMRLETELRRENDKLSTSVYIPTRKRNITRKYNAIKAEAVQCDANFDVEAKLKSSLTKEELSQFISINDLDCVNNSINNTSLDSLIKSTDDLTVGDTIAASDNSEYDYLYDAIDDLDAVSKSVVKMSFGLGCPQYDKNHIMEKLNLSKTEIDKILVASLEKIKLSVNDYSC